MDFTKPNNSDHFAKKRRAGWRTLFMCVFIFILGVIGLIAFAPLLISHSAVRERVVTFVNAQIAPAQLSIESWSLNWFGKQSFTGIAYNNPTQKTTATIDQITTSSLWKLLPMGEITAEIEIQKPQISLTLPVAPPPSASVPKKPTSTRPVAPATPQPQAPKKEPTPQPEPIERVPFTLPDWAIALKVTITDASVTTPQFTQPLLQNGSLQLAFASLEEAIQTTLSGEVLDTTVNLNAQIASARQLVEEPLTLAAFYEGAFSMKGPWINLQTEASTTKEHALPNASISLSLDTGKAFAWVRPLNLLPPTLTSISGQLALTTKVESLDAQRLHAACALTSQSLSCAYDGKILRSEPNISADLILTPENLMATEILQLNVALPGFTLKGAGTLTNGTLSAMVKTAPIWDALGPFIGDYPLLQPLEFSLTAKALADLLTVNIAAASPPNTLGEVALTLEALDPMAQRFKSLKLNSQCHLAHLLSVATKLPTGISAEGDLLLNLAAAGALNDLRSNLTFAYRNAKIRAASWNISEPSLLEGKATLTIKEQSLTLSEVDLSSPLTQFKGELAATIAPTLTAKGSLSGKLTPEILMKKWRVWGKDEKPLQLSGEIDYTLTAQQQEGPLSLTFTAGADTFAIHPSGSDAISLPLDLTLALTQAGTQTTLQQCAFTTDGLALTANGAYSADKALLSLKGMLTPDFDTLFSTLPALKKNRETFAISGKHERAFTFEAPITQGVPGILNYGQGAAEIAFDTVTLPGLDIPKGVVTLTLKEGVAAVNGVVEVNGGSVNLQPRLNLADATPVLTWEPNAKVLNRVRITPKLFDALLGSLNPVLTGSADPDGYLSLTCESLHLPLDQAPLLVLDTQIILQAESCSLRPNSAIKQVLSMALGKSSTLHVDDKAFTVTLKKGVITTDPLSVRVDDLHLSCQGSTNLATQAIDYKVTLPLNASILGRKLSKSAKAGETVTVPIRGTIKEPVIDLKPLSEALSETAVDQVKDKLSDKLEKALKKREEKRKKKGDSSKDSREEALENALRGLFGN